MNKTICSVLLISLISILTASCASTPASGAKTARLDVLPNGALMLDGSSIRIETLARDLKSAGYSVKSSVDVHYSSELSQAHRMMLSKVLTDAGVRRFVFIGPRKATSVITADTPFTSAPPPAPAKNRVR
jgi:hypothetical protein